MGNGFVKTALGAQRITQINLTRPDEVNTVLAAGRADICAVDARLYAPA